MSVQLERTVVIGGLLDRTIQVECQGLAALDLPVRRGDDGQAIEAGFSHRRLR